MATATDFAKMVPGFDFLQGLVKGAGAGMPNIGQWIAPTLDAEELEKRIGELRTVQFWLEQNARLLGATIQALEVQRMTLSTLKTLNLPVQDIRKSFELNVPPATEAPAPAPAPAAAEKAPRAKAGTSKKAATAPGPTGAVDPMQWWGALTQQFTELAATALKDTGAAAVPASAPAAAPKKAPARKRPGRAGG